MNKEQLDRLKRMALNAGGFTFHNVPSSLYFNDSDESLARLAMAITDECAKICSEMADADLSAGDCETAIRNLYREQE